MSDLQNFNNIHANLAESAYEDRPKSFSSKKYSKNKVNKIDYSQGEKGVDGGENLPNGGAVYLQPDETLHQEPVLPPVRIPNIITGDIEVPNYSAGTYQKGLLTDERGAAVLDGFYQEATDNDN